jgi:ATP-dependent RNA helicase DDX49/DBP8
VTLISQFDVALVHQIEEITGVEMSEVPDLAEEDVLKDISRVFTARRGAKMKMSENGGFDDQMRERKTRLASQKKQ